MKNKRTVFFSLKYRLFLVTASISIAIVAAVGTFAVNVSSRYVREELLRSFRDQTQQLNNILDFFVATLTNQALSAGINSDVIDFMAGVENDQQGYLTTKNVTKLVDTQKFNYPETDLYLFSFRKRQLISSDWINNTTDYSGSGVEELPWYVRLREADTDLVILTDFVPPYGDNRPAFAVALNYAPFRQRDRQGFIIYTVNKAFLDSIMLETSFASSEYFDIIITDPEDTPVYQSGKNDFFADNPSLSAQELLARFQQGQQSYAGVLVEVNHSEQTGWNVIGVYNQEQLYQRLQQINLWIITLTAVGCLVLLGSLILICNKLLNPLHRLRQLMREAEASNYQVRAPVQGRDEIAELSRCFNEMMHSVLENQVLRKEAEIYALQQQINPHFLYNTLGAVKTLTRMNRTEDVRTIIDSLSSMFRYGVNVRQNRLVELREEIRHATNYISIMELRYDHAFSWEIDVPDALMTASVPCFILQPVVENALTHGIVDDIEHGKISVNCREIPDGIEIRVQDNGRGMEADRLQMLLQYIHGECGEDNGIFRGVALKNVHQRLWLRYGAGYGVEMENIPEGGMLVQIRIGRLPLGEESSSVQPDA